MKKIIFSAVLLSCSFPTWADFLPTPLLSDVTVPLLSESFFVGAGLLFLQPTATDADLAYGLRNSGLSLQQIVANTGYDWGWIAIDAGYILPDSANDIRIDYWHFGSQDTIRTSGPVTSIIFPLTLTTEDPFITGLAINGTSLKTKPEFDYNQVNLSFGQYINFGSRLQFHPNAGLQFSRINQKNDALAINALTGTDIDAGFFSIPVAVGTSLNSTFNGLGPRIDFDGNYYIGDGFSFIGQLASALLVGNFTSQLAANINEAGGAPLPEGGGLVIPALMAQSDFATHLKPQIVPEIDGKLAFAYSYFVNGDISHVTLTAGYQAAEYFNALDYITSTGNLDRPEPVNTFNLNFSPGPFVHHMADFDLHGPFVALKFYF